MDIIKELWYGNVAPFEQCTRGSGFGAFPIRSPPTRPPRSSISQRGYEYDPHILKEIKN